MSFVPIAIMYFEPLEAAHVSIDDDRSDVVGCGAAGQSKVEPLTITIRSATTL